MGNIRKGCIDDGYPSRYLALNCCNWPIFELSSNTGCSKYTSLFAIHVGRPENQSAPYFHSNFHPKLNTMRSALQRCVCHPMPPINLPVHTHTHDERCQFDVNPRHELRKKKPQTSTVYRPNTCLDLKLNARNTLTTDILPAYVRVWSGLYTLSVCA